MTEVAAQESLDVAAVRREFPILQRPLPKGVPLVYVDNGASAQKPQAVIDKEVEVYSEYFANAYRGVYYFGARIDDELEAAREAVRGFLNARESAEVIFTSGTTMSLNLVANAWGRKFLQPGDEILLNEMEHHANLVPWQQIAREKGARLRYLPLTPDGRLDLDQLDSVLTDRTRIVSVTAMSNVLGTLTPVEELTRRAHDRGAIVVVDGAQSVPHLPTDVQDPQIDFLAFSGHKLFGPTGVGVLYGRREHLEAMDPFLTGGHMIDRVFHDHSTWGALPAKFEAGTHAIAQAIALKPAIEFVQRHGFQAIHDHEQKLLRHAFARLAEVPGLRIHGPSIEHRGPIVSFSIEGAHPQDVANLLDRKGVCVRAGHHCTMLLHDWLNVSATTRASFACYNTLEEIDVLCEGLHFARKRLRLE